MTAVSNASAGPDEDRLQWLATCTGSDHREAVTDLLVHNAHASAAEAAAEATALVSNPCTDFDDFAAIVLHHLEQWGVHDQPEVPDQARYDIPVDAPGERAVEWWPELALRGPRAGLGARVRWWHHGWLLRQAFAAADPVPWTRQYHRYSRDEYLAQRLTRPLIALLRYRSLPQERSLVLTEPPDRPLALLKGWDDPWHRLRARVPQRTGRDEARMLLAGMLLDPHAEPDRVAALEPVRLAVVSNFLSAGPERLFSDVDDRVALLTADDLLTLVRESGRCVTQSVLGWVRGMYWPTFGIRDAGRSIALTLAPLDRPLAEPHLRCRAPSHRVALVLNPFVPPDIAVEALEIGLEETEHLLTGGVRHRRDANPVVDRWWRALMAVRGWLPVDVVQGGMQRVAAMMLGSADPAADWLRHLAVLASSPDGLRALSRTQLARFDAMLADRSMRASVPWPRQARGDPYAPLMSPPVLRQVLAATGWERSGLLLDPAVVPMLADLPLELRVSAARRGEDSVLRHLVDDPEPRVRQFAARNRRAGHQTLTSLLEDPDPTVRSQVARNAGLTVAMLTRMSRDPDRRVSGAAARALLRRLAAA